MGWPLSAATALPRMLDSWVTPNRMLLEVLLGATPNRMLHEVFTSFLNYRVYSRWFRAELTELKYATIKLRLKIYDFIRYKYFYKNIIFL